MKKSITKSNYDYKVVSSLSQGKAKEYQKQSFTEEELQNEVWKCLSACSKFSSFVNYEVSNLGRVRNCKSSKILSPTFVYNSSNTPYLKVDIMNKFHKRKSLYVHRLVAFTFLEDIPSFYGVNTEVNHKDMNTLNNRLENLELCSSVYNHLHAIGKLDDDLKLYKFYWVRCKIWKYVNSLLQRKVVDLISKYKIVNDNGIITNFIEKYIEFPNIQKLSEVLELDKATIKKQNIPIRIYLTNEYNKNNAIDIIL